MPSLMILVSAILVLSCGHTEARDRYIHSNERLIFKEKQVNGCTTDEKQVGWELDGDQLVQMHGLSGSKKFVSNREKFIFNTFTNFKTVERLNCRTDAVMRKNLVALSSAQAREF